MLNPLSLKDIIKDSLFEKEFPDNWNALSAGVGDYIAENLAMPGAYLGTIPSVPPVPDPLSGPYIWKPLSVVAPSGDVISKLASSGTGASVFASFVSQLILGITFGGQDTKKVITLSAPVKLVQKAPFVLIPSTEFDINMINLATGIIQAILLSIPPVPPSVPSASTGGGVGATTFALVV